MVKEGKNKFRITGLINNLGFTLAEILIVIAVIGVVAAITIPTLLNTISTKAKKAQTDVIETRLLDGLNRYSAMEDGLSQKYETTYDFLVGLSKYYKMSQICKADEITKCIPYSKIYSSDGTISADVKTLKTIDQFILGETANNYLEPASFITAQGTPVVMALKKNCVWDMGQAMRSIEDSDCIAYLYDKNGAGLPNRLGDDSDIISHGLTVNGFPLAILGGVKIMTNAFVISSGLSLAECEVEATNKTKYTDINPKVFVGPCNSENDYWAGAMKYCNERGWYLPTQDQLLLVANALYKGMNANLIMGNSTYAQKDEQGNYYTIGSGTPLPNVLNGLGTSWYYLYSGEKTNTYASLRQFRYTYSERSMGLFNDLNIKAICVTD